MSIKGIDVLWRISIVDSKEFSTTDHSTLNKGYKTEWDKKTPAEYFDSVKRRQHDSSL